jgi:predicted transcriptional regulator
MKEEFAQLSKEQAQQVCKNIGQLAARLDVTHDAIATRIGLERPNVTRIFSGKSSPRLDIVFSVLKALSDITGKTFTLKDVDVVINRADEK